MFIGKIENSIEQFSKRIETMAQESGEDLFDVILEYCEETGMEPETANKLISESLRSKLFEEAKSNNVIKGVSLGL